MRRRSCIRTASGASRSRRSRRSGLGWNDRRARILPGKWIVAALLRRGLIWHGLLRLPRRRLCCIRLGSRRLRRIARKRIVTLAGWLRVLPTWRLSARTLPALRPSRCAGRNPNHRRQHHEYTVFFHASSRRTQDAVVSPLHSSHFPGIARSAFTALPSMLGCVLKASQNISPIP